MDGWTDGWIDGCKDGWTDGRMDGWIDGWKDGWISVPPGFREKITLCQTHDMESAQGPSMSFSSQAVVWMGFMLGKPLRRACANRPETSYCLAVSEEYRGQPGFVELPSLIPVLCQALLC